MIVKLIQIDNTEELGTTVYIKGLQEYLIDITKGNGNCTYLYNTDLEGMEVEPNHLFSIFVKTVNAEDGEKKEVFKFYVCELSETDKSCESWPLTGYCFGDFKVLFKVDGPRVTERLQKWWGRTKEPSVQLAKAIALDDQLREELV